MNLTMTRPEVYNLIDGERNYQDDRWNANSGTGEGWHSPQEWLSFIQDYTSEALHVGTRQADRYAFEQQMECVRKIAALAVAAMEQHGAPARKV